MYMDFLIYALIDPRNQTVKYIGLSTRGEKRARQHIAETVYQKKLFDKGEVGTLTHKEYWILNLLSNGLEYKIEIVENHGPPGQDEDAAFLYLCQREKYWIRLLRDWGVPLTNSTDGGDGCYGVKWSDDSKKRLSNAKRGKKVSEETKRKMALASSLKRHSQESRNKISKSNIGKRQSEESKLRMSLAKIGKSTGYQSEETRKKKGESLKGKREPVYVLEDNLGNIFNTQQEAADFHEISKTSVWRRMTGDHKDLFFKKVKNKREVDLDFIKSVELIIEAGKIDILCQKLNVTRITVYRWRNLQVKPIPERINAVKLFFQEFVKDDL